MKVRIFHGVYVSVASPYRNIPPEPPIGSLPLDMYIYIYTYSVVFFYLETKTFLNIAQNKKKIHLLCFMYRDL